MFINTTTDGASSRGISWVNRYYGNPRQFSFVGNFLAEVIKRPGIMLSPLAFSNRDSIPNTAQFFQGDTHRVPFSLFDNSLGDGMVDLFSKAGLLLTSLFEESFSRFSAFPLEFLSEFGVTFSQVIEMAARIAFPFAISRNTLYPQVHAQKLLNVYRVGGFFFARGKEVELTVYQDKVGLAVLMLEKVKLFLSALEGDSQSALSSPDRDSLTVDVPAEDSIIIGNRTVWLKSPLSLLVQLVGVGNFGDTSNNDLSGQIKLNFYIPINKVMDFELAKDSVIPGNLADVITSLVCPFKGFQQGLMLLWTGLQFDLCRKFHTGIIAKMFCTVKYLSNSTKEVLGQFLPRLKHRGLLARSL